MTPSVTPCLLVVKSRLPSQPCNRWSVLCPYSFCLFQNVINGSRGWPFHSFLIGVLFAWSKTYAFWQRNPWILTKNTWSVTTTTIKTQLFSHRPPPQIPQCCASVVTLCPHAVPMCLQAFNDLFSVPIILSFPESHINRILMYIASECTFFH